VVIYPVPENEKAAEMATAAVKVQSAGKAIVVVAPSIVHARCRREDSNVDVDSLHRQASLSCTKPMRRQVGCTLADWSGAADAWPRF
jgi:hypothetical protein